MIFQFDTNVILHYMKQTSVMQQVETDFNPFQPENECWACVVTIGELRSIEVCNNWGEKRKTWIRDFLKKLIVVDLNSEEVLLKYAQIEAYSQCRFPTIQPQPFSPRNMGKNDLWIAATASVLGARLLTAEADFDHLQGVFLDLARVIVPKTSGS